MNCFLCHKPVDDQDIKTWLSWWLTRLVKDRDGIDEELVNRVGGWGTKKIVTHQPTSEVEINTLGVVLELNDYQNLNFHLDCWRTEDFLNKGGWTKPLV